MKNILLIYLILMSFKNYSQNFSEKDLKKIESFGINLNEFNLKEKRVINDWNLMLKKEKRRKINKTVGIILTSLSVLSVTMGAKILSENKNAQEGIGQVFGGMFIAGGVMSAGISVPLFISSSKRKKERNKLIKLYNTKYPN